MKDTKIPYKIYLNENELPQAWYNLRADMKNKPAPLLNPQTHEPMKAEELAGVFCDELIRQELDDETAYFEIPEEIRNFYEADLMQEPQMLINCLVKEIIVFDDAIHIYFNSSLKTSPDDSQGFSFYHKTLKFAYKVRQRRDMKKFEIKVEIRV